MKILQKTPEKKINDKFSELLINHSQNDVVLHGWRYLKSLEEAKKIKKACYVIVRNYYVSAIFYPLDGPPKEVRIPTNI